MPVKIGLFIMALITCVNSFGQLSRLKGKWITSSHEIMIIADTAKHSSGNYLSNSQLSDQNCELSISGGILSFRYVYFRSIAGKYRSNTDQYDLKIISFSDTDIVVTPVSKLSRDFFNNQGRLVFKRQELVVDRTIRFEKIIFHSSMCFGLCREYDIQVDSSGAFELHVGKIGTLRSAVEKDTMQGYFTGKIADTLYDNLVYSLRTCDLRNLIFPDVFGFDAPMLTIIIYYNGQKKYFHTMFPPLIAADLVSVLYEICGNSKGKRTDERFEIDQL